MAQELDSDSLDRPSASLVPRGLLAIVAFAAMAGGVAMIWYASSQVELPQGDGSNASSGSAIAPPAMKVLSPEDMSQAIEWLREHHGIESPSDDEILLAAGGLALAADNSEKAIQYFEQVKTETPRFGMTARLEQGVALLKQNYATLAEQNLRKFLDAARAAEDPNPAQVLDGFKWLTFLLSVQIRQEERKPLLEEQHAIDLADPLDSKQLYFPNLLILNSPAGRTRLAKFLEKEPNNLSLLVASARYQTLAGEFDEAISNLKELRDAWPDDLVVAGALAEALIESDLLEEAEKLIATLPAYSAQEPWLLTRMRGEIAIHREQWNDAITLFNAALEVDPANSPSQMGVAMAYEKLGNKDKYEEALRRSGVLAKIRVNLGSVQTDAEAACLDLATQCRSVGMEEAARVFEKHASRIKNQMKSSTSTTQ